MKKYSMETTVGIFVVICLLGVAYLTVKLGNMGFLQGGYYSLFARFTSVSGLRVGSDVEMLGLPVGRVASMSMDQEDQVAVVKLSIRDGIKVYDDAIAAIKTSGLIGERFVSIDPGGGGDRLKPGGTISETLPPVDIGDLISKYAFGDVTQK